MVSLLGGKKKGGSGAGAMGAGAMDTGAVGAGAVGAGAMSLESMSNDVFGKLGLKGGGRRRRPGSVTQRHRRRSVRSLGSPSRKTHYRRHRHKHTQKCNHNKSWSIRSIFKR
jgi:hypothetical protein